MAFPAASIWVPPVDALAQLSKTSGGFGDISCLSRHEIAPAAVEIRPCRDVDAIGVDRHEIGFEACDRAGPLSLRDLRLMREGLHEHPGFGFDRSQLYGV